MSITQIALLLILVSLMQFGKGLSQNRALQNIDSFYYYSRLPEEFYIAPKIKEMRLKYYEVKKIFDDKTVGSGYAERKVYYDTSGIPIDLKGMNRKSYNDGNLGDDDYLLDSTFYKIDALGRLDSFIKYYRTGRTQTETFFYDDKGFCILAKVYDDNVLSNSYNYTIDANGKIVKIQKGNDIINFKYENYRIMEIEGLDYYNRNCQFIYDDFNYIRYQISTKNYNNNNFEENNKLMEKIYYDQKWNPLIRYKYQHGMKHRPELTNKTIYFYSYDAKGNLSEMNIWQVVGDILNSLDRYEMRYNSVGDCIEEKCHDRLGNVLYKYQFIYKYYD